ncbi:uncharacterized protein B0T23DRAFT_40583 [Neurospora hispaniola]|uniref:Uncharacterized protein n=1 Tax=Neurospora hispaniola TaxID=588809 RepID=A0AAJ0IHC4_9PEZI|nr:hypothetical protein B0T23DRAFT_40583 [Neurospora hispaniola]
METSRALEFVPLPKLGIYSKDLSNFRAWKHGIWFHLSYYKLDGFLRENENEDEDGNVTDNWELDTDEVRRRRFLAYSIIWSSAENVIPSVELTLNKNLCDDPEFDPKKLWQLILEFHKIHFPSEDMEVSSTT